MPMRKQPCFVPATIFPVWKLGTFNLAINSIIKYSEVIKKESLQTLSHDNVLKVIRFSIYSWIQVIHVQKVARVYHMTNFSKFLHWDSCLWSHKSLTITLESFWFYPVFQVYGPLPQSLKLFKVSGKILNGNFMNTTCEN